MWKEYYIPSSLKDALETLQKSQGTARIVAGATDLILELERGLHPHIHQLIDITRLPALDQIEMDKEGWVSIGPMVTHNHCVQSEIIRASAPLLAEACWEVGSPQIRNRATLAGNLITASPANDTITPLMALDAQVTLTSINGQRDVPLNDFYTGVRKTVLAPNELLTAIRFRAMDTNQRGTFIKLALRRAQAISVINVAVLLTRAAETVTKAVITLGAVAPTIIHAKSAEQFLTNKPLTKETIEEAAALAAQDATPIDDLRSSAAYRKEMVRVITRRSLNQLAENKSALRVPPAPVLLWGQETSFNQQKTSQLITAQAEIKTTINGQAFTFKTGQQKTLLHLLRDEGGFLGAKEGCAEGECGACTVFLDGKAVMSCMVPAPRAQQAVIKTVEGLSSAEKLHPVQQAFIDDGAVQCGYCTPGFLMSSAKLLEEKESPSHAEIEQALTGNLCRCTGYYKIIQAVEHASKMTLKE